MDIHLNKPLHLSKDPSIFKKMGANIVKEYFHIAEKRIYLS